MPHARLISVLTLTAVFVLAACAGPSQQRSIPLAAAAAHGTSPTITLCTSGFGSADIALRNGNPHDAFIAIGPVVKHISDVAAGSGPCTFGSALSDIALNEEVSWGVALDNSGNLYVTAGSAGFITKILKIAPPYSAAPALFYSGQNFRSLAIAGNVLYAADFCTGHILRFNLNAGPSSVATFATVPGLFGIFAAGVDDLYVTSNSGDTGCGSGFGSDDVKHVTKNGVAAIAAGLSFPEGISGDNSHLYIAAGAAVYTVPISGGMPSLYAGSPILYTHGVAVWKGGGYVTDSNASGHVYKFTLLP